MRKASIIADNLVYQGILRDHILTSELENELLPHRFRCEMNVNKSCGVSVSTYVLSNITNFEFRSALSINVVRRLSVPFILGTTSNIDVLVG